MNRFRCMYNAATMNITQSLSIEKKALTFLSRKRIFVMWYVILKLINLFYYKYTVSLMKL